MDIAQLASHASFDMFSEQAEINGELVEAIIDRNVEVVDVDGNVRQLAAVVHVKKVSCGFPEWVPGDLLEADSGNVRLRQVITDDGFIQRIEASPA
jgi:hypothetical protein